MNGTIIPHTPIAVDYWRVTQCHGVRLFFLTHMHSDHTQGLKPTWSQPIHCSPVSAKLLIHKFKICSELVISLEVNASHIINLDEEGEETMTVTVMDANHCPGAVMYLFEGYFGVILYTGDFRYQASMFVDTSLTAIASGKKIVDVLYLDNTYCTPACEFPDRDESTRAIIDIIRAHPDHSIVLALRLLGKEQLLVDLALEFQIRIVINETQLSAARILELPDVFTTDPSLSFIRVEPFHEISADRIRKWNQNEHTIVILPTAMYTGVNGKPYSNLKNTHIVTYSDHSSYSELMSFVQKISPRKVIPVVAGDTRKAFNISYKDRADMSCFQDFIKPGARNHVEIPMSVKRVMNRPNAGWGRNSMKRRSESITKKKPRVMGVIFDDDSINIGNDDESHAVTNENLVAVTDNNELLRLINAKHVTNVCASSAEVNDNDNCMHIDKATILPLASKNGTTEHAKMDNICRASATSEAQGEPNLDLSMHSPQIIQPKFFSEHITSPPPFHAETKGTENFCPVHVAKCSTEDEIAPQQLFDVTNVPLYSIPVKVEDNEHDASMVADKFSNIIVISPTDCVESSSADDYTEHAESADGRLSTWYQTKSCSLMTTNSEGPSQTRLPDTSRSHAFSLVPSHSPDTHREHETADADQERRQCPCMLTIQSSTDKKNYKQLSLTHYLQRTSKNVTETSSGTAYAPTISPTKASDHAGSYANKSSDFGSSGTKVASSLVSAIANKLSYVVSSDATKESNLVRSGDVSSEVSIDSTLLEFVAKNSTDCVSSSIRNTSDFVCGGANKLTDSNVSEAVRSDVKSSAEFVSHSCSCSCYDKFGVKQFSASDNSFSSHSQNLHSQRNKWRKLSLRHSTTRSQNGTRYSIKPIKSKMLFDSNWQCVPHNLSWRNDSELEAIQHLIMAESIQYRVSNKSDS